MAGQPLPPAAAAAAVRPLSPKGLWISAAVSRPAPLQVEFYFSDSNLPKDKFLKERIAEDPDGCEHTARGCRLSVHCAK